MGGLKIDHPNQIPELPPSFLSTPPNSPLMSGAGGIAVVGSNEDYSGMDGEDPYSPEDVLEKSLCCPSALAGMLSLVFPCAWIGGCQVVNVKEESIVLNYGKYVGTLRSPGCHCVNPFGTEIRKVSVAQRVIDIATTKVADAKGTPVIISGIVTYKIKDSKKSALEVSNEYVFIKETAVGVLKTICARYPYESKDHDNEPSLKSETGRVQREMIGTLQAKVEVAGAKVMGFDLTDLSYAPEVAAQMLVKQQAEVMLEAREAIVEGAVSIAEKAVNQLASRGTTFSPQEKARLISNILVTITSSQAVQPTVNLDAGPTGAGMS